MSAQDSSRSPKRQRRSYSPASPSPAAESTQDGKSSSVNQAPQTPPPSVHMSPSWTSQQLPGLQYSGNGSGSNNGGGGVTFPTPPSTAGFQSQMMGRGMSSEGEQRAGDSDEGERGLKRKREEEGVNEEMAGMPRPVGDVAIAPVNVDEDDAEHRRTDHERQQQQEAEEAHVSAVDLPGAKVLYKLRADPIPPSAPHPSQNLFSLYNLHRIQSSVARRDPQTGEKINKLRKSYEGKIKDMGIEGRNKATKSERILEGLVDPGWNMLDAGGSGRTNWSMSDFSDPALPKDVGRWDEVVGVEKMLDKALQLRPGSLPRQEHESWKNLLGLDDHTTNAPAVAATAALVGGALKPLPATTAPTPVNGAPVPQRTTTNPLLARTFPQGSATSPAFRNASAPSSPRPLANGAGVQAGVRPERTGKKRRYDESSYAGYAEGYRDDDEDGDSAGGNDRRGSGGMRKQRRKEGYASSNSATSPTFSTPAGGGGGGNSMVGVRSS